MVCVIGEVYVVTVTSESRVCEKSCTPIGASATLWQAAHHTEIENHNQLQVPSDVPHTTLYAATKGMHTQQLTRIF